MKAEWRKYDWLKSKHPERERDYETYEELVLPDGGVIGRIEQFATNPRCFYATTPTDRSGCLGQADWARQWVETKTGNKVN
jgi:hypothetical protein